MPRRNTNAGRSTKAVGKTLYARSCDACGFLELSYRASFVTAYRRCPSCNA